MRCADLEWEMGDLTLYSELSCTGLVLELLDA